MTPIGKGFRVALVALALQAAVAQAETARVTSGEHEGFTRLSVVLPRPADWRVLRTAEGYRLEVPLDGVAYDLSRVFGPLSKGRLAAIAPAPDAKGLGFSLGCACYAIPFELRPGIVVIDLRDGAPPAGSAFELDEQGNPLPPLAARPVLHPRPRPASSPPGAVAADAPSGMSGHASLPPETPAAGPGYDWLAMRAPAGHLRPPEVLSDGRETAKAAPHEEGPLDLAPPVSVPQGPPHEAKRGRAPAEPPVPVSTPPDDASAGGQTSAAAHVGPDLRESLVEEMARAAAAGTIELLAEPPGEGDGAPAATSSHLRIGNGALLDAPAALSAEGADCLPDARVDPSGWGKEGPAAATLGDTRAALLGEFDQPDPDAAAGLVRQLLYFGFGIEARQIAENFAPQAEDRALWEALSHIVDGEADPSGVLDQMETCDGWVALWAVLARPDLPAGPGRMDAAVLRSFSALPLHLRRHLGPPLADRYLAAGLDAPAQAILAAILRATGDPGPETELLRADIDVANGKAPDAGRLAGIAAGGGDAGVRATVDLIEAAAAEGAVSTDLILGAEALRRSREGSPQAAALDAAIALGRATQGDFDTAFALVAGDGERALPVWRLLAARGTDAALLAHAVMAEPPPLPDPDRQAFAGRLLKLGLAEPALAWLGAPGETGGTEEPLLRAEAELLRGDARAVLRGLAGVEGDAAAALRQAARARLDPAATGPQDDPEAAARAWRRARDWPQLAAGGPDPWREAAARVAPLPEPAPEGSGAGPLARGRALIDDSAAARKAVAALLAATDAPVLRGAATP